MKNRFFHAFLDVLFVALYCFILNRIAVALLPSFRVVVVASADQVHGPMIGIKPHYDKAGYVNIGYGTAACKDTDIVVILMT
jgi:hypothetical protein